MKRSHVKMFLLCMLTLLLVAAMGCSSSATKNQSSSASNSPNSSGNNANAAKVELRFSWWGSQSRHDRFLKVIELYQEKNPHVTINGEFSGFGSYFDSLSTKAAGGNLPDIIQMDFQYISEYISKGLLVDLQAFADKGLLNLSDIDDSYLDSAKVDNKLYGIQQGGTVAAIAYDPEMFKSAGVDVPSPSGYSWEAYMDAARKLKNNLGEKSYVKVPNDIRDFTEYLKQNGQQFYSPDGKGLGYDDKHFIDFYTMWRDLRKEGVAPGPEITQSIKGLEDEMIVHKISPTNPFTSNQITSLVSAAQRPLKLMMVPQTPGGIQGEYMMSSGWLSVSSQSKYQEEAAKFIDFYINDLEAGEILEFERGMPPSSKVRDHLKASLDDTSREMLEFVELVEKDAVALPLYPPNTSQVVSVFEQVQEEIDFDVISVEEGAAKFRAKATEILAQ